MAKSKAKKLREKLEREGKRNPLLSRSEFANVEMYKRMALKTSCTKKDKLYKNKHKKQSFRDERIEKIAFLYA